MTINNLEEQVDKFFHGKEGYNCSQTVLRILKDNLNAANVNEEDITNAKAFGGGRAPNGYCGALYGALLALSNDSVKNQILNDFQNQIGNLTCREIKQVNKKSCKECILSSLNSFFNNM